MDRAREAGQLSMQETLQQEPSALSATGIVKSYRGPGGVLEVLRGVDLEVKRGTILAIVGVSGSGKSTLLNILGTLARPDRGTLAIRGRPVDGLNEEELARLRARRIGFVFQFHHLMPEFSAEENVMMPLLIAGEDMARSRSRAREALTAVGLEQRWEHRPSELSGGEAQRVAVARALAPQPELVLADEPSGNLDPGAARHLQDLLATLARETHQTFVIVTHNDRLASLADRVLTLESGRLVTTP
jgi:lipoprotein-releasing system ATP-binding protein